MKYDETYLLARLDKSGANGCWNWTGAKDQNGYGRTSVGKAHRLAFKLWRKEPGNLFVCHHCDNPPCCNPDHLFLGTHQDNMADAMRKGRLGGANSANPIFRFKEHIKTGVANGTISFHTTFNSEFTFPRSGF